MAVTPGLHRIADALDRNRHAAALLLKDSIAEWEKYAPLVQSMGTEAFIAQETVTLVDRLIRYFRDDDVTWRNFYIGERFKQLHWTDTFDAMMDRRVRVFSADHDALLALLQPHLEAADMYQLVQRMDRMRKLVSTARTCPEVKVLFVGDCLYLDLNVFLAVPLLESGLLLHTTYATSKNPVELRSTLRGLVDEEFDLICYSPYTYEFSLPLFQTQAARNILRTPWSLRRVTAEAHRQMTPTLRLLCEHFDRNLIVHNTANIRRHHSVPNYVKGFAGLRARRAAAKQVNALLMPELAACRAIASRPITFIDEMELLAQYGEWDLGRKFYDSDTQHTTAMAEKLSGRYHDMICAAKFLLRKKVVVVDLDNTLWNGVIGEGDVEHDHSRQQILKRLRQKGVLLAIASKNDPRSVSWNGAVLSEADFVASQIHWEPKNLSIKRIAEELNLHLKDFVFIDDRPDEREMVRLAIPGIYCMDATNDATWRMLEWWASALPEQNEEDRTQLYQERKLRQSHLDEAAEKAEKKDQQQLLSSLGLRLRIRPATQKDLPRAVELINRTNQFNTCGSRVNAQQVAAWSTSSQHRILVAEASDKFGAMGIISVMVLEKTGDALAVPVWVLSCRVFGFGMETALLNQVRLLARELGASLLRGPFVETPNNQPCRDVYAANGFSWNGSAWELPAPTPLQNPPWLSVFFGDQPSGIRPAAVE